ncbi:MarR family winged helix-turn-helix transcriptional regulator [Paenibacillus sp. CC-CFT747]|nr:MarR family winged helix-turn-helix transcriptional regulator [Paenibacillus sp. CC-CFT747]
MVLEVFRLNGLLLAAGDRLTSPVGLSSARWQVLGVVEHGAIPVAHVARIMGLTRQSVQQTADALERDGLIVYRDNPHHLRSKLMELTPKGREALDYVTERHSLWANEIGEKETEEALRQTSSLLRRLAESLEQERCSYQED